MELVVLEVSGKQNYIFRNIRLRENLRRSDYIAYITGSHFFKRVAAEFYNEDLNLIYAGGGHTILQFDSKERAKDFVDAVTNAVIRRIPHIELFAKIESYSEEETPGQNLKRLTAKLEQKKSFRKSSFRQTNFGVEALSISENQPEDISENQSAGVFFENKNEKFNKVEGWKYPEELSSLKIKRDKDDDDNERSNFISVVHIDGNAMGKRVDNIYQACDDPAQWDDCCKKLRSFSEGIQKDFEDAFKETVNEVIDQIQKKTFVPVHEGILPIRPVILQGDDVCFVTAGKIGIECARIFLEKLSKKINKEDGRTYAACAGVAIVHEKYPFYRAYKLSEELCAKAKELGVSYKPDSSLSMIDWHIEFGQLKSSITEIRKDYNTEDGARLELRPYVVCGEADNIPDIRRYKFFKAMVLSMMNEVEKTDRGQEGKAARSKIKEMRKAFKQGEIETRFAMHDKQIHDIVYNSIKSRYPDNYVEIMLESENIDSLKDVFVDCGDGKGKRCQYFDAIEIMDNFISFNE